MADLPIVIDPWRQTIIDAARLWLGTPYRHQASLRGVGCDCLGLVRGLWRELYGTEPETSPNYSSDWAEASGEDTLLDAARRHLGEQVATELMPGDVALFRWRPQLPAKHVGLLMPGNRLLHAYQSAGSVVEGDLTPAWRGRIAAVFAFPRPGEDG
jgi:NlpC/P60 family putative phage cell wall peptidase